MSKGIIYYTDNRLKEPIFSIVQRFISASNLPITSVSLKPIDFGSNYVFEGDPCYLTMLNQILIALEKSTASHVFFCEHDVLYPASHFEFSPKSDSIWYYNAHVYRWKYPENHAVTYDRLISLSSLCVNREYALRHFRKRMEHIQEKGWDKETSRDPLWARRWGYEPGTKKKRRGGFSNDDFETWRSDEPIIDIRHGRTFTHSKVTLDSFIHQPTNWKEILAENIPQWSLNEIFNINFNGNKT